jgi:hypothetical protein
LTQSKLSTTSVTLRVNLKHVPGVRRGN